MTHCYLRVLVQVSLGTTTSLNMVNCFVRLYRHAHMSFCSVQSQARSVAFTFARRLDQHNLIRKNFEHIRIPTLLGACIVTLDSKFKLNINGIQISPRGHVNMLAEMPDFDL